jgi:hypothetical protein
MCSFEALTDLAKKKAVTRVKRKKHLNNAKGINEVQTSAWEHGECQPNNRPPVEHGL